MSKKPMTGRGVPKTRDIKKLARHGDPDAMIALLNRSVSFRHDRLAIFRYHLLLALCDLLAQRYAPYCAQAKKNLSAQDSISIANRARERARSFALQRGWIDGSANDGQPV